MFIKLLFLRWHDQLVAFFIHIIYIYINSQLIIFVKSVKGRGSFTSWRHPPQGAGQVLLLTTRDWVDVLGLTCLSDMEGYFVGVVIGEG